MNQFTSISIVSMVLMGGALTAHAADYFDETKAATVFAFDSVSIQISGWKCASPHGIRTTLW